MFEDFDHHLVLWKRRGKVFFQELGGEIDEAGFVFRDPVDTLGEEGGGQQTGGGAVAIQVGVIVPLGAAKEQFIGKKSLIAGQNGLPGDEDVHAVHRSFRA